MFSACLHKILVYLLATIFLVPAASATEVAAASVQLILADGTPVRLQLAENVSSARTHVGDRVNFVVVQDVNQEGFTVIPAGTMARGSITAVKGRRFLGIGGKVTLKLDSLELANGDQVGLRARKEVKGGSRTKLMVAGMIATGCIFLPATPILLLIRGQQSTVVKSTEITAQIDGDTTVLTAGLQDSPTDASELDAMMDYLPPRVFNAEGREGDMLNLVFVAQTEDLQAAFARAGWVETDQWKPAFVWHLLRQRTNDAALPMARFYLFGRVQDYSYALPDPSAVVTRRHHLRIWKTGSTVDGTPVWAGAATHDVAIEIAKHGRLINHRIDPAVDDERDFIGTSLTEADSVSRQEYLQGVDPVFLAQTASGESYHSDSRILLLDLSKVLPVMTAVPPQASAGVRSTTLTIPIASYSPSTSLALPR